MNESRENCLNQGILNMKLKKKSINNTYDHMQNIYYIFHNAFSNGKTILILIPFGPTSNIQIKTI